jgi:hypothetical protein
VDRYQVFVPSGLLDFVPKGQTDSSQAVYCLGSVKKRPRPVRDGVIKSTKRSFPSCALNKAALAVHAVPTGRPAYLNTSQAINCLATSLSPFRTINQSDTRPHFRLHINVVSRMIGQTRQKRLL